MIKCSMIYTNSAQTFSYTLQEVPFSVERLSTSQPMLRLLVTPNYKTIIRPRPTSNVRTAPTPLSGCHVRSRHSKSGTTSRRLFVQTMVCLRLLLSAFMCDAAETCSFWELVNETYSARSLLFSLRSIARLRQYIYILRTMNN